jgi:hypothetical protein
MSEWRPAGWPAFFVLGDALVVAFGPRGLAHRGATVTPPSTAALRACRALGEV